MGGLSLLLRNEGEVSLTKLSVGALVAAVVDGALNRLEAKLVGLNAQK